MIGLSKGVYITGLAITTLIHSIAQAEPPVWRALALEDQPAAGGVRQPAFVPQRLLIRFEPTQEGHELRTRGAIAGVTQLRPLLPAGAARRLRTGDDGPNQIFVAELNADANVESLARTLSDFPGVRYAEPDYLLCACETVPDDSRFPEQWALSNTGQNGGTPGADIRALDAWDVTTGADAVVVGVIDSGIDYMHPDLAANMWRNPGESGDGKETDGIDNDQNGYVDDVYGYDFYAQDPDPTDARGHGTHVAGTIAAVGNNGLGVAGVSWSARLMALRFIGAVG